MTRLGQHKNRNTKRIQNTEYLLGYTILGESDLETVLTELSTWTANPSSIDIRIRGPSYNKECTRMLLADFQIGSSNNQKFKSSWSMWPCCLSRCLLFVQMLNLNMIWVKQTYCQRVKKCHTRCYYENIVSIGWSSRWGQGYP